MEFENVLLEQMNPKELFCGVLKTSEHEISLKQFTQRNILIQTIKRKDNKIWIQYKHFVAIEITFQTAQQTNLFVLTLKPIYYVNELSCFIKQTSTTPWNAYDPITDFERMDTKNWRLSNLNKEYKFSKSYPSKIMVPKTISDNTIRHCAKFRSKERIPVLCYVHSNKCSITRASQPLVGITYNRSIQDEKLVEAIFNSSRASSQSGNNTNTDLSGVTLAASGLGSVNSIVENSCIRSGLSTGVSSGLNVSSVGSVRTASVGVSKVEGDKSHEKVLFKMGELCAEDSGSRNSDKSDKAVGISNDVDTKEAPKIELKSETSPVDGDHSTPISPSTPTTPTLASDLGSPSEDRIAKDEIPGAITLSYHKRDKMVEMVPIDNNTIIDLQTGKSVPIEKTNLNLIIDARPLANAIAQTAMGAGTEIQENYKNSKLTFLGIENIHVVRDSFMKLFQACCTFESGPVQKLALEKSGWLKHIKSILKGTNVIVKGIDTDSINVLIHCSDGWDRTAQLSALSQICLDPYYRTIKGLITIVEKEWLSFGHKFKDRQGILSKEKSTENSKTKSIIEASTNFFGAAQSFFSKTLENSGFTNNLNEREVEKEEDLMVEKLLPKEISPVFLQFLDCLYQIWTQYPTEFEYDERLLEFLYIASNSCEFGNFVFNSEFERKSFMKLGGDDYVEKNTKSVWQHVYENQEVFKNFLFDQKQGVLYPKSKNLRYWSKVYKISRVASDDSVAVMKIDDVEGVAKSERMEPEIIALKSEPVKRVDQLKVISDGGSSGSSWMDVNYSDTRNVSDVNIPNPLM